jgi:hypothetical protein
MSHSMIEQIYGVLPDILSIRDFRMVFSLIHHGASLDRYTPFSSLSSIILLLCVRRMFSMGHDVGPCILIIKDEAGFVFGAFTGESWRRGEPRYYGTRETFLFSLRPSFAVYKWSFKNSFFQLARDDGIAIGGGNHFGIWLDSNLRNGSSLECQTFDSPSLSSQMDFRCMALELWAFC